MAGTHLKATIYRNRSLGVSIALVAKTSSEKAALTALRRQFVQGKKKVRGWGVRGDNWLLLYFDGPADEAERERRGNRTREFIAGIAAAKVKCTTWSKWSSSAGPHGKGCSCVKGGT